MFTANTVIIALTVLVSVVCFNNRDLFYRLSLNPYSIRHRNEWWRIVTHGFVHADYMHLFINMFVLWSFGRSVLYTFGNLAQNDLLRQPSAAFLALYLGGMIFSALPDVVQKKDDYRYNSIGASGAVSAVVFTVIFFAPWSKIYFMGILPIPSLLFGALYLWYSQYMSRRGGDNTNHMAHFWGAIFGLVFPLFIDARLFLHFLEAVCQVRF